MGKALADLEPMRSSQKLAVGLTRDECVMWQQACEAPKLVPLSLAGWLLAVLFVAVRFILLLRVNGNPADAQDKHAHHHQNENIARRHTVLRPPGTMPTFEVTFHN